MTDLNVPQSNRVVNSIELESEESTMKKKESTMKCSASHKVLINHNNEPNNTSSHCDHGSRAAYLRDSQSHAGSRPILPELPDITERRGLLRLNIDHMPRRNITQKIATDYQNFTEPRARRQMDIPTMSTIEADEKLIDVLQSEMDLPTPNLETIPRAMLTPGIDNRCGSWECGFNFTYGPITPSSAPSNKEDLGKAVRDELVTVNFLKAGLAKYRQVINTGEHTTFPKEFLDKQNRATHVTLVQLERVGEHLQEILNSLADLLTQMDNDQVRTELVEMYCHAKPWIARTRAIIVHSHAYYKINYRLAADI